MRLLLASAIFAASAAATFLAVTSPAAAQTHTYPLSGFTKIDASAGFTIEFTQSPTWSVVVDSASNAFDRIIVEKIGDTLRISRPQDTHNNGKVRDVIRISAPDLDALTFHAAIRFTAPQLNVDTLAIDASAAVAIDIADLTADRLDINADAASTITLAGSCTKLNLTTGAASKVMADGLRCRETQIDAGTASSVHAFASDKAVARAGMASHVLISGRPREFQEAHEKFGSSVSLAE